MNDRCSNNCFKSRLCIREILISCVCRFRLLTLGQRTHHHSQCYLPEQRQSQRCWLLAWSGGREEDGRRVEHHTSPWFASVVQPDQQKQRECRCLEYVSENTQTSAVSSTRAATRFPDAAPSRAAAARGLGTTEELLLPEAAVSQPLVDTPSAYPAPSPANTPAAAATDHEMSPSDPELEEDMAHSEIEREKARTAMNISKYSAPARGCVH